MWQVAAAINAQQRDKTIIFTWRNNNNSNRLIITTMIFIVTFIMTEVIAGVHSVHLVNVQRQAAADPQTKLGL